jgi:hypothetical protein
MKDNRVEAELNDRTGMAGDGGVCCRPSMVAWLDDG